MGYFIGIDLGSTTTKAVILDERERVVGRGLTNTRSNYEVATEVAKNEAIINARFALLRRAPEKDWRLSEGDEDFLGVLEKNFRYEQHLAKLKFLQEACLMEAEGEKFKGRNVKVKKAMEAILEEMEGEAWELFSSRGEEGGQFFRDMVSSRYLSLAETHARALRISFEDLMGIYDKSIIKVENQVFGGIFEENIQKAIIRTLGNHGQFIFHDEEKKKLQTLVIQGASQPMEIVNMVGTGYGRQRLPFNKDQIRSEILCHGLGAHFMFPGTRTVLDIGGQDTKAIQVDERGIVTSFQMNDRCAAGCGRYLGYIADELNIGLQDLGPLSLRATRNLRINSTCTVFAGAELRDLLGLGESKENILAGLHRSIVLRAMSLLARSGGIHNEFTFTGGVAKNPAVVKSLMELTREHYGNVTLNIHPDSIYTGAIGAALFALRVSLGS